MVSAFSTNRVLMAVHKLLQMALAVMEIVLLFVICDFSHNGLFNVCFKKYVLI